MMGAVGRGGRHGGFDVVMEALILMLVLAVLAVPAVLVVGLVVVLGLRGRVLDLERRVQQMHLAIQALRGEYPAAPPAPAPAPAPTPAPGPASPQPPPAPQPAPAPAAPPATAPAAARTAAPRTAAAPPGAGPAPPRPAPAAAAGPDLPTRLAQRVRLWFSEGNVPVKIGMLVLIAGVAALLRYAGEQGWMSVPLELRLAGVAAAAVAGLWLGWRQRDRRRVFALSLQGGAIGVLLMTVFSAFRVFDLLPVTLAFPAAVVLVASTAVLAVVQNARALAILALAAGFLAPVLVSTGQGSHVVLFGYYALLNLGILGVALKRQWPVLNLLGFVSTFAIGMAWGVLAYRPEQLASTLPFLVLFFGLYLLVALLHARHRALREHRLVDGTLVFGNPLLAFVALAGLLQGDRLMLAFGALAVALVHALLAVALRRRGTLKPLAEAWAVIAVGFATLSVPLALSAGATAAVFAVEGAALVWLGLRQQRRLPLWSGLALQVLAALAVFVAWDAGTPRGTMVANTLFMGTLLLAVSGLATAAAARAAGRGGLALTGLLWGLGWWLLAGGREIARHLPAAERPGGWIVFMALSLALIAVAQRRRMSAALDRTAAAGLAIAALAAFNLPVHHALPVDDWLPLAWLALALGGFAALRCGFRSGDGPVTAALAAWAACWTLGLMHLFGGGAGLAELGMGWQDAGMAVPLVILAVLVLRAPGAIAWPVRDAGVGWRPPMALGVLALGLLALIALGATVGDASPLPWVPVLNPLELAMVALALTAWPLLLAAGAGAAVREWRPVVLALLGFAVVTDFTLRASHHLGGAPWGPDIWSSAIAQSALSIVWSVLGVVTWVLGSRRRQRLLWLAGAVLMGVVLLKLVLVDRQHLGNLAGIASFIGYGLLCTVVGWLAPAPPSRPDDPTPAAETRP